MADLETKTKKMIKEEIQQTKDFMKETSQKTYAEITKKHNENVKSAVTEIKEDKNEQKDIESRKNNIIIYGIEERIGETNEKEQEQDKKRD